MKKWWVTTLLLISLAFSVGFFAGQNSVNIPNAISFYGIILEKSENKLHIQGIPENDINHRGEFIMATNNIEQLYNEHGQKITIEQLNIGAEIRITYDGMVMESYPSQLTRIYRIDLIQK